ncbi:MAG TPA: NmrA family NAD(P)-binding protein [Mycobacterium sp.]|nr:NmrA family NAD(P)-binding protein [Mycobacterium sp.]HUH70988.1 NmrA family NAD(P)-binding protein [Mycobacterium sp.]
MRVLMVGATGRHAHLVLPELIKRGVIVRALVRNQERAQVARHNGADETVIGDLREPASLTEAVAGMEGVFHIGPAHAAGEAEMGLAMVDAARAAGVRKFVYSGVIHPSISAMTNHAAAKLPVEEALYSSELDFTVLQPARFMQNFERSWNDVVENDRLAQPYSLAAKMCSVDYRDVAEVAAMAMTGDELSYGTFELCAPGMQDGYETAAILSEVLGRPITAEQIPLDQFASRLPEGPFRDGMTRMMAHYDRHGLPGGNPLVLRAILGREPRSLKDYFRELASR